MKLRYMTIPIVASLITELLFCQETKSVEIADDIPLPSYIQAECITTAWEEDIPPEMLMAIVYGESKGHANAKNGPYIGLTQLNPIYFKKIIAECEITDPWNAYQNLKICARQLSIWYARGYSDSLVLECWSEGDSNAILDHSEAHPSNYAKRTLKRAESFKTSLDEATEKKKRRP